MSKPEIVRPKTFEEMSYEERIRYDPTRRRRSDDLPEIEYEYDPIAVYDAEIPSFNRDKR